MLLVEDDANDIELILFALREVGLAKHVDVVRDGLEGIDYLLCRGEYADRGTGDPAVVLLDINMPKMNGIETLKRIKQHPKLINIPIVMLTSSKRDDDIEASYELGANAYVVKPMEYTEFMKTAKSICEFWMTINQTSH
jgi:CheY-like chemotaxis protein